VKHCVLITAMLCVTGALLHAEETYNLEIIFRCTAWDTYPDLNVFGIALAGGDVNGDGYSDIAVEATHYVEGMETFGNDVYLFFGGPAMDTVYDAELHLPEHLGHSPSGLWIGDINGDSIGDVLVGDEGIGAGYVWVFFGGTSFDTTADLHLLGELSGSAFGCAVTSGDVNGDGCDDIIVGSYCYNGFTLDGRVYVYYGGALLDSLADVIIDGHDSEAFGKSVGSGGDVNSDGFEDIVVGADENSEAYWGAGKVYVFYGGNPMNTWPDCWLHGEGMTHYLGWFGCDIMQNEDDYDMVITGTSFYPYGFPNTCPGKVYLLQGGNPMDTLPDLWMVGQNDSSTLGEWCCSAGDVDGDGHEDALVGAPYDYSHRGSGYLWLGGVSMDTIPDAYLRGGFDGQYIGWRVASAGDVNGDGYDEVMFSNYVGVDPTVWVCRYTGPSVQEHASQIVSPNIHIEPNPFSHILNIDYSNLRNTNVDIRIFDITGREVMHYAVEDKTRASIDTRSLPGGVYFIEIRAGAHRVVEKGIKTK
jgi:hypothetical protein